MKVAVTGATGFVAKAVLSVLKSTGLDAVAIVRVNKGCIPAEIENIFEIGNIGPDTVWDQALKDIDVIIHLAGRAHIMHETSKNPLETYRLINFLGTQLLAESAGKLGVKKFVFLSSVKAKETCLIEAKKASCPNHLNKDPYGLSKLEGERALIKAAEKHKMNWVILRSPLVYGEGVKGNFLSLMRAINNGWILPVGAIRNRRSLIFSENLAEAIVCAATQRTASGTYYVTDGSAVSTPELVTSIAKALDRSPRLLRISPTLLRIAGGILGRSKEIERLLEDLEFDNAEFMLETNWTPTHTMAEGLAKTAYWYKNISGKGSR